MKIKKGLFVLVLLSFASCASLKDSSYDESSLNAQMTAWHKAAAVGNSKVYFDLMDRSFIYLGTDISERWDKESFMSFCKPSFDKGSRWDFKATSRTWYFNGKTAWFEENLNTWMGPIRASGVRIYKKDAWKITHYNLTLTVDNDKIKSFIELNPMVK
jgi:hypothetical protein